MKQHEKKPQPIHEAESHMSGEMKNVDEAETRSSLVMYTGLNFEKLERNALCAYEHYGKNMNMEEIIWRGWQKDLRQYLDRPCNRKIIWIVGEEGNEGKSFFQRNICEEFGYSRVCKLELGGPSRDIFHILGKLISSNTDIFLFNYQEEDIYLMNNIKYLSQSKMVLLHLQSMMVVF